MSVEKAGLTKKIFFYEIPHEFDGKKHNCPKFKSALKLWLGEDNKVTIDDIFEIIGYCMTMNVGLKKAFYFYGQTDGGKTTFQTILDYVIGNKNRSSISLWRMNKDQFGTHNLQFKLINMVGDLASSGTINNIEQFLQVAGGDLYIYAEPKGKGGYQFRNTVKLIYNSNNLPIVKIPHAETKKAFYNRFIIVNFPLTIPKDKIIRNFAEDYILADKEELLGIIAESIRGLTRLYKRKDFRQELIENTTHEWQMNSDSLYHFLYEWTEQDTKSAIPTTEFLGFYNDYLIEVGAPPETNQSLPRKMERLGIYKKSDGKQRLYVGIKWKGDTK